MMTNFNSKNYWLVILAFCFLFFGVFYNLGLVPLYLEEPRRALIALEMIFNDNIWVPTEFGEYYYKKPPFFNWIIILGFKTFGNFAEFSVRFYSIIFYLLTGLLTFFIGKKYVDTTFGIYSAFVYFTCADLLFYFTITSGEIDLFYSFVTFAGIIATIYFFLEKKFFALFIVSYFFTAIGFLTKGIPSLVFQMTTLIALFVYDKQVKILFSLSHVVGLIVFFLPVLSYVAIYNQWNSFWNYFNTDNSLLTQSTERTILYNSLGTTILGILGFPFLLLKILAPGSLLALFVFKKGAINRIKENRFLLICAVLVISNILIYWISPGTRSRYLYMFFPLFSMLLVGLVHNTRFSESTLSVWNLAQSILLAALLVLLGYLLFDPRTGSVQHIKWIVLIGILSVSVIMFFYYRKENYRFFLFIFAIIIARCVFSFSVLPVRAASGMKAQSKNDAYNMIDIIAGETVYMYKNSRISRTSVFYLERSLEKVVSFDFEKREGYQIVKADYWNEFKQNPHLYDFQYDGNQFALFRVINK